MGQRFNEVLRPSGVARSQWYILYFISRSAKLTQKELQAILGVESATLTVAINALVRKGWVVRCQSSQDHRVKELQFTPEGKKLWEGLPDPILAIQAQMLKGIRSEEAELARSILEKAIHNLEQ